uniref:Uncharacterized protein n=1 Tax=Schistocephalus solidus TaxID=70667 RepID=A0A0V0J227_SCHSO
MFTMLSRKRSQIKMEFLLMMALIKPLLTQLSNSLSESWFLYSKRLLSKCLRDFSNLCLAFTSPQSQNVNVGEVTGEGSAADSENLDGRCWILTYDGKYIALAEFFIVVP